MECSGSDQAWLGQAHLYVPSLVALPPFSGSSPKHKEVIGLQGIGLNDRLIRKG